ncbi:fibrinogen-like protein A [Saccostrea cucullata]|uniref:fibrinogen-like protein A n=1 Tax=Saccostrea cuccullata TaxID=36930 RepID=UPI002ED5F38C
MKLTKRQCAAECRQICKPGFTKPCQCPSNFGDERCKYKYDCQGQLVSQNTTTYRFWRLFSTNEWRELLCEMTVDNGGWIVFQRRVDGSTDFYRNWTQYETGFGDLSASFYMGNSQLHEIVKTGDYELRIELEDQASQRRYAAYTNFFLGGPETSYKLKISGYHGNADDGLNYHNDMKFSTFDNDNDIHESGNCAEDFRAAWWYLNCYRSNLNGVYGRHEGGMYWVPWQGFHESLKSTMMMVRKKIP